MTLTQRKLQEINFKELHRRNPEGTERLLRDVMNYKKPGMFRSWSKLIRWLVLPLGIALTIWMLVIAIIWIVQGAPIFKLF